MKGLQNAGIAALVECIVGIISNSLLLIVIFFNPLNNLRKASWMIMTNLALADLLTSMATIPNYYPGEELLNHIKIDKALYMANVFLHIGYSSSFFFILLFAIERYIAIKHPIQSSYIITKKRNFAVIILCWAVAIIFGGLAYYDGVHQNKVFIGLYGILELATLVMILFQILIIRNIKEASENVQGGSNREAHMKNISVTIVMLILILIVTAFPFFIAKQVEFVQRQYPHLITAEMANLFPYYYLPVASLNFILNPFIYAWRFPDYRWAFGALFKKKSLRRQTRGQRSGHTLISQRETIETTPC